MRRKAWNLVLSLRFKLLCAVLALFFTFAGVTTYFWYDRLTRQASDAAANNLHAMLRISNSNFETALKDRSCARYTSTKTAASSSRTAPTSVSSTS